MIRKVIFSNFYSFYKEQEISFLSKKKNTYDYYQSKSGNQISKVAGFIGGNASGKTNAMRFFSFLSYFICRKSNSTSQLINDIAYKTFFNNNEPSRFYIEYELNNSVFYYNLSIKNNTIQNETLSIKYLKKGSRKTELFSRQLSNINYIDNNYFKNLGIAKFPEIRKDVSFIAFIKKSPYNVDIINNVYDYFLGFKTNINEIGQINHVMHQFKTLEIYIEDVALKKEAENLMRYFDIGLKSFTINKKNKGNQSSISIQGTHSTNKGDKILNLIYESRGTQSLFFTMANIISALKNNNVVIIDEIESGLHPEALNKLISYFIEEDKDNMAQIIFSSHSLGFMNKLDMHQIYLVEKNNNCESSVHRLNTVKDIRPDENFLAKYMSGSYGAFPRIRT